MKNLLAFLAATFAIVISSVAVHATSQPSERITLYIGFKTGGGTDTQARLIGAELSRKHGWKILYKNVVGKGGGNLARTVLRAKADGLTLGLTLISTFTYNPIANKAAGYSWGEFDYIITTAPTQYGLATRADGGWTSVDDLAKAADRGQVIKLGITSPRLRTAASLLGQKYGFKFTVVKAKGGLGVLNELMSGQLDAGFIGGIHSSAVKAGQIVNLLSLESERLAMSPDVPTLAEVGLVYDFGSAFVLVAPKGLPAEAKAAIGDAVASILQDENSKARKFIVRTFGMPLLERGAALEQKIAAELATSRKLLGATR